MVLVVRIIVQASDRLPGTKKGALTSMKHGVKGTIILLPILGLTWVFGILTFNSNVIVFEYVFAIFNSLQGVFIFVFYCVLNSEVQGAFSLKRRQIMSNSVLPSVHTNKTQNTKIKDDSLTDEHRRAQRLFVHASRDPTKSPKKKVQCSNFEPELGSKTSINSRDPSMSPKQDNMLVIDVQCSNFETEPDIITSITSRHPSRSPKKDSMQIIDVQCSNFETEPEEINCEATSDNISSTSTLNQSHNSNQTIAVHMSGVAADSLSDISNPFQKKPKLYVRTYHKAIHVVEKSEFEFTLYSHRSHYKP
ncbi:latrophilin-like protein LAT-2 [Anneissia japonica]|uniref:latrophilin-like protein LAT-2 n=1 Tax=Anneissia japonica TaxID=1529436 RepID=UPI0014256D5A|nr:latrophilin-like protein LAT-2 [Anneissia japonica]